jgi:hypothetical protein
VAAEIEGGKKQPNQIDVSLACVIMKRSAKFQDKRRDGTEEGGAGSGPFCHSPITKTQTVVDEDLEGGNT